MLAPALRWHLDIGALEQFQQGLLHTLSADIACDGGVVAFSGNFVDFIDEDNAAFGRIDVEVRGLQEPGKDTFHVFSDVAGLGEHCRIGDAERDVQHPRDGLGQ